MSFNKKIIALIPARGGSKGVVKKNVKLINDKPLIAWSIEQALNAKHVTDVYVSTDDEQIQTEALKYGAKVPFLRPDFLATDISTTESVMDHFSLWLLDQKIEVDALMLLQPTSPVRAAGRLDQAINFFYKGKFDSILSVSETHKFFWRKISQSKVIASYDFLTRPRRQDINKAEVNYQETGSIYLSDFNQYCQIKNRLFGNIGLFVTPENESYEIDTLIDFEICETLLKNL